MTEGRGSVHLAVLQAVCSHRSARVTHVNRAVCKPREDEIAAKDLASVLHKGLTFPVNKDEVRVELLGLCVALQPEACCGANFAADFGNE